MGSTQGYRHCFREHSDNIQAANNIRPVQDALTAIAWAALEDANIVLESIAVSDYINADGIVSEECSHG